MEEMQFAIETGGSDKVDISALTPHFATSHTIYSVGMIIESFLTAVHRVIDCFSSSVLAFSDNSIFHLPGMPIPVPIRRRISSTDVN